ncbi:MAG: aminopeptidase P family protein [Anaerolineae bacterium]|nr:aminopeptidase P family protein [Anaerolineae bacterium]
MYASNLLQHDLDDGGVMIFAQGRDAGVPHSRGEAEQPLQAGQTLIFDLFPRPVGGGYYHDMTRTWCLGHAPEHVQRDFGFVLSVFHRSLEEIQLGRRTSEVDKLVCEWMEAAGHPTRLNSPATQEGYVHSLGHGIGLEIHEHPGVSQFSSDKVVFEAGHVVTIEPGVYYPSRGYGIRVEDALYLDTNGDLINLTDCPYDLVIPLQEA